MLIPLLWKNSFHEEIYRSTRSKPIQRPNVTKQFVDTILNSEDQSEDETDVEGEVCAIKPCRQIHMLDL